MFEKRNVLRFKKRSVLLHWLHAVPTAVLLVTGALMFFDLPDMGGARLIRDLHRIAAAAFIIFPLLFALLDPKAALLFLKEAFRWDRPSCAWLMASPAYYFGRPGPMPPQGYLNGDQRLWQLTVVLTGFVFALTGILMWFFRLQISMGLYAWILFIHAACFILFDLFFLLHLYLATLHPRFDESLAAMVDGRISPAFAREHYPDWYEETPEEELT